MRIVYYARVSTNSSEQELSLEAQQEYFKSIGIEKGYYDRGISGTSINRDGFKCMLYDCGLDVVKIRNGNSYKYVVKLSDRFSEVDYIYCKSISRFSRDIATAIDIIRLLKKKCVYVKFLDMNLDTQELSSEMVLSMLFTISTEESHNASLRVKQGNSVSASQGRIRATRLYGYRYSTTTKQLEIEPNEAIVVQRMFDLRVRGYGSRRIANILKEEGIRNRSNKPFLPNVITRLLQNASYIGISVRNKYDCDYLFGSSSHKLKPREEWIETPNKIPPIIKEEIFYKVQDLIENSMCRKNSRGTFTGFSVLARKVYCNNCGHVYYRNKDSKTLKNGEKYELVTYRCSNKRKNGVKYCKSPNVKEEFLFQYISTWHLNYINFVQIFQSKINVIGEQIKSTYLKRMSTKDDVLIEDLLVKKQSLIERLEKLLNMYLDNKIIEDVYNNSRDGLEQELAKLQVQINALQNSKNNIEEFNNKVDIKIAEFIDRLNGLSEETTIEEFIENHIHKIWVTKSDNEKGYTLRCENSFVALVVELKQMVTDMVSN